MPGRRGADGDSSRCRRCGGTPEPSRQAHRIATRSLVLGTWRQLQLHGAYVTQPGRFAPNLSLLGTWTWAPSRLGPNAGRPQSRPHGRWRITPLTNVGGALTPHKRRLIAHVTPAQPPAPLTYCVPHSPWSRYPHAPVHPPLLYRPRLQSPLRPAPMITCAAAYLCSCSENSCIGQTGAN